ncbi:MAG: OmpA family protein [Bacteroidales bacterium]
MFEKNKHIPSHSCNKRILSFTFFIIFSLYCSKSFGQYFLYTDPKVNIETSFIKHSIEAKAKQVVFNGLRIKNNSNKSENLTLNITVPQGWNVIGDEKIELTLAPLDSIIIPIRVAVGTQVKGNIGYSIIASISDYKGNTVKNEYCFVKIPRLYDLQIKIIGGISYFETTTLRSEFSVLVKNRGNREEPINIYMDGSGLLSIESPENNTYAEDITIKPYSDSIITYKVLLKQTEYFGKNMFPLLTRISTIDSVYNKTIWFKKLDSKFANSISSKEKPLSIELTAQGLLEETRDPVISAIVEGKVLFNGNNDVYYYYRNFASSTREDLYKSTRMYLGVDLNRWNIEIGDSYRTMESLMLGRGGYVAYNGMHSKVELIANKNIRTDDENYGSTYSLILSPTKKIFTGLTYNKGSQIDFKSKLGYAGGNFVFKKRHSLYFLLGYNQLDREVDNRKSHNEYGGEIRYNSSVGATYNSLRLLYHTPLYYSPQAGRLDFSSSVQWELNMKNRILFQLSEYENTRPQIEDKITISKSIAKSGEAKVEHIYRISQTTNLYWGPAFRKNSIAGLTTIPDGKVLESYNYLMTLGARIKLPNNNIFISPKIEISKSKIANNPFDNSNSKSNFSYQYFSLNLRSKILNLIAFYTAGPRNINEQLSYAYLNRPNRKLQVMPSIEMFVYKNIVRLNLGLSYTNDIETKFSYSSLTGQVTCFFPHDWKFYVLAVYSLQKRTTSQDYTETYQTFYAEASLRKEFSFQHPRVKYHDVELSFFKDFDGNYVQDENEPGIKNVLVRIEKSRSNVIGNIPSDIVNADLLSDNSGKVLIEKIPEGIYTISYNPIGKEIGNFSKAKENVELIVDKSGTYYFPFVEKNKVFGKIILNRSKLSGLGNVDISNIRITATDSRGNTFTTLTDKNGEFLIYAPVTDEYIVNINNIFYENFDLRQNNFRVQFNGYKQFEVNFVFDEKVRRINFSPSTQDNLAEGVLQIRRTNLRGTIKDATSLKPLRARINLINTKNNSVVTSIYSNPQTGDYSLSFLADDIYQLEILADDYWYYSENLNLNQVTTFMNVTKDILLKQISIGSKIELNIKFVDINKATLGPEAVAELNRLLRILRDNSNIRIEVQGHCDDLEAINNPQIGEERAKAVAKYLIENGFSNLQVRGFGNTSPVAPNDTEENRTLNRRVEIEVISK